MSQYGRGQYGQQQYGNGPDDEAISTVAQPVSEAALDVDVYTQEVAFPFRFTEQSDVLLVNNDNAISDSIKLASFVKKNGIPLVPLGAGVGDVPFDPLDTPFRAFLGYRLKASIELGVSGVTVDHDLTFTELDNNVEIAVRYVNERTDEVQSSILAIPRFRTDK